MYTSRMTTRSPGIVNIGVGVVWVELVTTSIILVTTSKK